MKILVVGGVAGGMSAAARARRLGEDAEIVVFERGAHVSFANCGLPYHIGREIKESDSLLLQTPESLRQSLNLDVRIHSEVVKIDRVAKKVTMFFTFWGLNSLRRNIPQAGGKGVMDFMFGEMMPKGADKLKLSQMNMCGI